MESSKKAKKSNKGQIKLEQEPSSLLPIKSGVRAGVGSSFKSFKSSSFIG
jgi:hypothetical protein